MFRFPEQPLTGRQALFMVCVVYGAMLVVFFTAQVLSLNAGGTLLPWDTGWYGGIALFGYSFDGDSSVGQPVAFLPLYPLLVAGPVHLLGAPLLYALYGVGILLTAAGSYCLVRLLDRLYGARAACVGLLGWLANPFAFYWNGGYSECVMAAAVPIFMWLMLERKNYLLAALIAGVAVAGRPYGIFLGMTWCLYLAVTHWQQGPGLAQKWRLWLTPQGSAMLHYMPLLLIGMVGLSLFYWFRFDDAFVYRTGVKAWEIHGGGSGSYGGLFTADRLTTAIEKIGYTLVGPTTELPFRLSALFATAMPLLWIASLRRVPWIISAHTLILMFYLYSMNSLNPQHTGRPLCLTLTLPFLLALPFARGQPERGHAGKLLAGGAILFGCIGYAVLTYTFFQFKWVS